MDYCYQFLQVYPLYIKIFTNNEMFHMDMLKELRFVFQQLNTVILIVKVKDPAPIFSNTVGHLLFLTIL